MEVFCGDFESTKLAQSHNMAAKVNHTLRGTWGVSGEGSSPIGATDKHRKVRECVYIVKTFLVAA